MIQRIIKIKIISGSYKPNNSNANDKEPNLNQTNDEFTQKIFELELIIKEKEEIIYTLHSKIKEFSNNIDLLKIENEKLKSQIIIMQQKIKKKNLLLNNDTLKIQKTQRFIVFKGIYNESLNDNACKEYLDFDIFKLINNNSFNLFNDIKMNLLMKILNQIIPFQMQPFKPFDHKKLEINDSIIKIDIKKKSKLINGDTFLDNIIVKNDNNNKYKINDNIYLLETNCRNN